MRSLMTKLVLAFLLTSVAGVALASIIIRQLVTRQFDDYVLQQQRDSFIAGVQGYYETNGSLDGIDGWWRAQFIKARTTAISPSRASSDTTSSSTRQTAGEVSAQSPDGPAPDGPAPGMPPIQFGLVDASGVIQVPYGGHTTGQQAAPDEVARGTSITSSGRVIGTVITGGPAAFRQAAEEQYLARTDLALLIAAGVMVAIALALGALLARVITRPVRELTTAAGRIAAGDLQQQVPVRSRDELGVLAAQFNHMCADLARATQLRRQMTADVAHDLRTPLTVISGYMEALRDEVLKPTPERFATMYEEMQLLSRLVDDLHTLSLADAGELRLDRRTIAPQLLLGRVADALQHEAQQRDVTLHVRVDERIPDICVDVDHMIRALSNLVSNALHYTPPGGQVTLLARTAPAHAQLIVADTGAGIAPEHLPFIFERSYRADASRQQATGGSGLGLAIVKSLVDAHGGQVKVESTLGQGASFTISLPLR